MTTAVNVGERSAFTPSATIFRASISRPLSVSSRIASDGRRMAICSTSLRFFSPPEKPTLTLRFSMSSGIDSRFISARAVQRGAQEVSVVHPRQFHRILERQEQPGRGARLRLHLQQIPPVVLGG